MLKTMLYIILSPVALAAGVCTVCIAIGTVKAIVDGIKKGFTKSK